MRPLDLTLEGFRSYADRARFDWRGRRLVGIVGPIGSGKSTILDGIAFALYGKTPAITRGTHALIHQQRDAAQVQMTFRVEGGTWQVTRAIRRKGAGQHLLAPFDEASNTADQGRAVTGERAVNERIERLLGLDFSAFQRSILLAQGRFQEFLQATPTDRDKVLRGVFGLDRIEAMHAVAREREREARADADQAARQIAALAEARERIAQAEAALAAERAQHAALEALRPRVEAVHTEANAAKQQHDAATAELGRLADLAKRLPRADQSEATIAAFESGDGAATEATKGAATAAKALQVARKRLEQVVAETGTREQLAEAQSALDALALARTAAERETRRVATATTDAEAKQAAAAEAKTQQKALARAETTARKASEAAVATHATARAALDAAQHRDMAIAVRAGVAVGDACPVCGVAVKKLPKAEPAPDLDAARAAEKSAQTQAAAAQGALQQAVRDAASAAARVEATERAATEAAETLAAAQREAAEAKKTLTAATKRVTTAVGDPAGAAAALETRRKRLGESEAAEVDAERAEQAARREAEKAAAKAEEARRAFVSLRLALAEVAGALGLPADNVDDAATVRALLGSLRARYTKSRADADTSRQAAEASLQAAQGRLDTLLAEAGVDPRAGYAAAITDVQVRIARTEGLLEADRRVLAGQADLEREAQAAGERFALYNTLTSDLVPSQFLGYLLADERATLASIGSERFQQLSGGRYRFKDENFVIADLSAAEAERNPDTLSGGESFLASLSLALALAEMVTREGGRLDAFFLDEGFGSLDEEHLDLAMEGIERLVAESEDRLVVIVSHVPALKERIEDLVILDRNPATGHTLVRRGAGPQE